jgi:hypothetical protein
MNHSLEIVRDSDGIRQCRGRVPGNLATCSNLFPLLFQFGVLGIGLL